MNAAEAPPMLNAQTPPFFDTHGTDQLMHMVLALAAELSAVTEEVDTLRQLLVEKGSMSAAEIEAYAPSSAVQAARAARRDELVRAMFASLETQAGTLARAAADRGAAAR